MSIVKAMGIESDPFFLPGLASFVGEPFQVMTYQRGDDGHRAISEAAAGPFDRQYGAQSQFSSPVCLVALAATEQDMRRAKGLQRSVNISQLVSTRITPELIRSITGRKQLRGTLHVIPVYCGELDAEVFRRAQIGSYPDLESAAAELFHNMINAEIRSDRRTARLRTEFNQEYARRYPARWYLPE